MKERTQDKIKFFFIFMGIPISQTIPMVYPYYGSYMHIFNKSITINQAFQAFSGFSTGQFLGTVIFPPIFLIFGIRNGFLLLSLSNLIMALTSINITNIFGVLMVSVLIGIGYSATFLGANLYFSQKYENGASDIKILNIGWMISGILFTFMVNLIINPANLSPTLQINNELFFEPEIAHRFSKYIIFVTGFSFIVTVLGSWTLKNP